MRGNNIKFTDLYIELETLVKSLDSDLFKKKKQIKKSLGSNLVKEENLIEKSYLFKEEEENIEFIRNCRKLRNISSHNKFRYKGKVFDIYEPTAETLEKLEEIIWDIRDPKLEKISISFENIFWKKLDDLVFPSMKTMSEKVYTHIPILNEKKVVIGVFSENTIFSYLLDQEIIEIPKNMTFRDLEKYLDVENHLSEIFKFVKFDTKVSRIRKIFEEELKENKKIGMVFITENGKQDEPLLKIVTPWDLVGDVKHFKKNDLK